ncbi:MAG: hypothetical protein KKF74_04720 [Nanoarchaeota archaeon]|nr:hypothetical protein [Nanoarchaeota archaeon]
MIDYIKHQLELNQSSEVIKTNLIRAGWKHADIEEAFKQITSPPTIQNPTDDRSTDYKQVGNEPSLNKPKSVNVLSNLFLVLALLNIPGAFTGSAMVLILNHTMKSIPGGLEFSALKAMPFVGLISVPGMIAFPLLLLAALKIRSGSLSAWRLSLFILVMVIVVNIATGFLTRSLVNPIYQATTTF